MKDVAKEPKDIYRTSRVLYIAEAALDYFVSLLVSGAYLARLTSALDISDSITGILSTFVSLGCGFQLFAIFLTDKKSVKRWVTAVHTVHHLCFCLMYVTLFFPLTATQRTAFFAVFLMFGYVLNHIVNSPKINWFMSLVPDDRRGTFTAIRDIVSLLGGVLFLYVVGAVTDYYDSVGNTEGSFVLCGCCLAAMTILHSLTLIFSREKVERVEEKRPVGKILKQLFGDKNLFKIILIFVFLNVARNLAVPFYGTYQIKELGFSMTFVSLLSVLYAVCRSVFEIPLGKIADKYSPCKVLNICFLAETVAFAINIFTVPSNGKVFYSAYYMLDAIGMAGINSGTINLIYGYAGKERRTEAFALKNIFSGFAGFFTALAISPLVKYIQSKGNVFLGMNLYAQQAVSGLACIVMLFLIGYMCTVIKKLNKDRQKRESE